MLSKLDLLNLIPEKAQGIRKKDLHSKSEHKKEQAVVESLAMDTVLSPLFSNPTLFQRMIGPRVTRGTCKNRPLCP